MFLSVATANSYECSFGGTANAHILGCLKFLMAVEEVLVSSGVENIRRVFALGRAWSGVSI